MGWARLVFTALRFSPNHGPPLSAAAACFSTLVAAILAGVVADDIGLVLRCTVGLVLRGPTLVADDVGLLVWVARAAVWHPVATPERFLMQPLI